MMSLKRIIFPENQSLDLDYVIHILSFFVVVVVDNGLLGLLLALN